MFEPHATMDWHLKHAKLPIPDPGPWLVAAPSNSQGLAKTPAPEAGPFTKKLIALMQLTLRRARGKEESSEGDTPRPAPGDGGFGVAGPVGRAERPEELEDVAGRIPSGCLG